MRWGLLASIVVGWAGVLMFGGCVGDDPANVSKNDDAGGGGDAPILDAPPIDATPADRTVEDTAAETSVTGCTSYAALATGEWFCDDFDGASASPLWFKQGDAGAGISIGGPGKSAPNSLLSSANGVVPAGPYYWAKIAGTSRTKARAELDLHFDAMGSDPNPRVGLVGYAPNGPLGLDAERHLRLEVQDDKLTLVGVDENAISTNLIVGPPLANGWVHVSLIVDHGKGMVTLEIDGVPISMVALPADFPAIGTAVVAVGVLYTFNVTGTWAPRYDNVGLFLQ